MMTRLCRAALMAAFFAAPAAPVLAQSAPMGAPSDAAPPAPLRKVSAAMVGRGRAQRVKPRPVATPKPVPVTPETPS